MKKERPMRMIGGIFMISGILIATVLLFGLEAALFVLAAILFFAGLTIMRD